MNTQTPQEPVEQTPQEPVENIVDQTNKSWVNGDLTWNKEAMGDLGGHSIIDKYQTVEDLITATINKDQLIGKKIDELLSADDPEIQSKLKEIRGAPADPSEYDMEIDLPENLIDENRLTEVKKLFHELGIPKDTAKALIDFDAQQTFTKYQEQQQQFEESLTEAKRDLKAEWKNKHDNNIEKTINTLEWLEMDEVIDDVKNMSSPLAIKFAKMIFDKVVPIIENDEIIEAKQRKALSSVDDQISEIDEQLTEMYKTKGNRTPEYQRLLKKKIEVMASLS